MISRLHWMTRSTGLLSLGLILLVACTGDTGPAGLVNPGTVSGKLTVWEDAQFNSLNSPTTIPAGGFTVSLVGGDSTRTANTGPDGSYSISNVTAGAYTVESSRDPFSVAGYGTMKRYNFFVGGGSSFHSGSIGRNAPKPNAVSAGIDSVASTSGAQVAGIRVAWNITPHTTQFTTFSYLMTFQSPGVTATASVQGSGALSDTSIVVGLPAGTYIVSVQSDIGFGYVDEAIGTTVFPTRSATTTAPLSVSLTKPAIIDLGTKFVAEIFPGKKVVLAHIAEESALK